MAMAQCSTPIESDDYLYIPAVLFSRKYTGLSSNGKLLYSILRDNLRGTNSCDCSCTMQEISWILNCTKKRARQTMQELEKYHLVSPLPSGKIRVQDVYSE